MLGAFFHDIGHLLGEQQGLDRMITGDIVLGVQHHAEKGQAYLESLGFKGHMCDLVGMHVQAKRYLVATINNYCKLSTLVTVSCLPYVVKDLQKINAVSERSCLQSN